MDLKMKFSYDQSQIGRFRSVDAQRAYDKAETTKTEVTKLQDTFAALDGQKEDRNILPGQVLVDGALSGFYDSSTGELSVKKVSGRDWPGGGSQVQIETTEFRSSDQEKVWKRESHWTTHDFGDNKTERTKVVEIRENMSTGVISVFENV